MSAIEDLCRRLLATCSDAVWAGNALDGMAADLKRLEAQIKASMCGHGGIGLAAGRQMLAEVSRAYKACGRASQAVREADVRGRRYIAATVGGGGDTSPKSLPELIGILTDVDDAVVTASNSAWWPPNQDLGNAVDHVVSGHFVITFQGGGKPPTVALAGVHSSDLDPLIQGSNVTVDPVSGLGEAEQLTLSFGGDPKSSHGWTEFRFFFERVAGVDVPRAPVKRHGTSFYPDGWSEQDIEDALREAWNDPKGTRQAYPSSPSRSRAGKRVDGSWAGTGRGLRIKGYFNPRTGECITGWPLP